MLDGNYPVLYSLGYSDPDDWIEAMESVKESLDVLIKSDPAYVYDITSYIGPRSQYILEVKISKVV